MDLSKIISLRLFYSIVLFICIVLLFFSYFLEGTAKTVTFFIPWGILTAFLVGLGVSQYKDVFGMDIKPNQ